MIEMMGYAFFQKALLVGIVAGLLCGFLSVFVVSKKMAFIGQGISHAAFGGVALGLFLGLNPMVFALIFALIMAFGISALSLKGLSNRDSLIGIFMATAMALGVIFLSRSTGHSTSVMSYLFGSILSVGNGDIIWLMVVAVIVIAGGLIFFKELQFYAFDELIASLYGIPVRAVQYGFFVSVALAIIVSMQIVGVILITALLVIPGSVALIWCKKYKSLFWISTSTAVLSAVLGLILSYFLNIPSGATIVIVLAAAFAVSYVFGKKPSKR